MMLTIKMSDNTEKLKKYHCPEITTVHILVIHVTCVCAFIRFYINGIKLFT